MPTDIGVGPEIVTPARAEGYTLAPAVVSTRGRAGVHPRPRVAASMLDLAAVSMRDPEAACTLALAEVFPADLAEGCTQALAEAFIQGRVEACTRAQVAGCMLVRKRDFMPS